MLDNRECLFSDSIPTYINLDDFGDFSNEPPSHQQPTQSNNPTPPTQNDTFGGGSSSGGGGGGGLSLGAQFLSLCNETLGGEGGLGQE